MKQSKTPKQAKSTSRTVFKDVEYEELDQALFKSNLKTIRRYNAALADILGAMPETFSTLVSDGHGQYDIRLENTHLYNQGHKDWAKDRLDNFEEGAGISRLHMPPIDSNNLDDETNVVSFKLLKRSVDAEINFLERPIGIETFHVIILGIGLGEHLLELVQKTKCRNLMLVEPNIEFIFWSCYVFDWTAFEKEILKYNCDCTFIFLQTPEAITDACISTARFSNPAYIEGLIFFQSYQSSLLFSAYKLLTSRRDHFGIGLGFIEDEIDMVRNSYRNLKDFVGNYYVPSPSALIPLPFFVIGGGPSLDNDLEFIKKNQHRAIIVSCGTTLRTLLKNGIMPDFQMEMENVKVTTRLMKKLSDEYDLSKITLIASNTIYPGVKDYFNNTVFYIRSDLSSTQIFSPTKNCSVSVSMPTVANLGFSFAQEVGGREIYTFGVDLGTRDPSKHHSADAAYNVGELEFDAKIDIPTPGNFGGDVLTERVYLWSKSNIQSCVQRYPSRLHYNCSDGVLIEGMIPKLSSTIELHHPTVKSEVIKDIMDRFPHYGKSVFKKTWHKHDRRKAMKEFTRKILDKCEAGTVVAAPDTHFHDLDFLFQIIRDLIPQPLHTTPESLYFKGSGLVFMTVIFYYYSRINEPEKRKIFADIARDEFASLTREISDLVLGLYDYLEDEPETLDVRFEQRGTL